MRKYRKYTCMTVKENILALSMIKGVGANFIKKNLPLISAYSGNIEMLSSIGGKVSRLELEANIPLANKILDECYQNDIQILSIVDDDYPSNLKQLKDPPPILYCKGNIDLLKKAIAIIGTRKSSELGDEIAYRTGSFFTSDFSVCNGLVEGIDKSSIYAKNQVLPNVIGVLSGGLKFEKTSSKVTRKLANLVLNRNGLLVSEVEPNKKESQFSGSKASRIQAGISNALILIQSKTSGGSKYTLKAYSVLDRPIGVISFKGNSEFENSENFSGNRLILEKGLTGLAEMCDIKKAEKIKFNLIPIQGREDFKKLKELIQRKNLNKKL